MVSTAQHQHQHQHRYQTTRSHPSSPTSTSTPEPEPISPVDPNPASRRSVLIKRPCSSSSIGMPPRHLFDSNDDELLLPSPVDEEEEGPDGARYVNRRTVNFDDVEDDDDDDDDDDFIVTFDERDKSPFRTSCVSRHPSNSSFFDNIYLDAPDALPRPVSMGLKDGGSGGDIGIVVPARPALGSDQNGQRRGQRRASGIERQMQMEKASAPEQRVGEGEGGSDDYRTKPLRVKKRNVTATRAAPVGPARMRRRSVHSLPRSPRSPRSPSYASHIPIVLEPSPHIVSATSAPMPSASSSGPHISISSDVFGSVPVGAQVQAQVKRQDSSNSTAYRAISHSFLDMTSPISPTANFEIFQPKMSAGTPTVLPSPPVTPSPVAGSHSTGSRRDRSQYQHRSSSTAPSTPVSPDDMSAPLFGTRSNHTEGVARGTTVGTSSGNRPRPSPLATIPLRRMIDSPSSTPSPSPRGPLTPSRAPSKAAKLLGAETRISVNPPPLSSFSTTTPPNNSSPAHSTPQRKGILRHLTRDKDKGHNRNESKEGFKQLPSHPGLGELQRFLGSATGSVIGGGGSGSGEVKLTSSKLAKLTDKSSRQEGRSVSDWIKTSDMYGGRAVVVETPRSSSGRSRASVEEDSSRSYSHALSPPIHRGLSPSTSTTRTGPSPLTQRHITPVAAIQHHPATLVPGPAALKIASTLSIGANVNNSGSAESGMSINGRFRPSKPIAKSASANRDHDREQGQSLADFFKGEEDESAKREARIKAIRRARGEWTDSEEEDEDEDHVNEEEEGLLTDSEYEDGIERNNVASPLSKGKNGRSALEKRLGVSTNELNAALAISASGSTRAYAHNHIGKAVGVPSRPKRPDEGLVLPSTETMIPGPISTPPRTPPSKGKTSGNGRNIPTPSSSSSAPLSASPSSPPKPKHRPPPLNLEHLPKQKNLPLIAVISPSSLNPASAPEALPVSVRPDRPIPVGMPVSAADRSATAAVYNGTDPYPLAEIMITKQQQKPHPTSLSVRPRLVPPPGPAPRMPLPAFPSTMGQMRSISSGHIDSHLSNSTGASTGPDSGTGTSDGRASQLSLPRPPFVLPRSTSDVHPFAASATRAQPHSHSLSYNNDHGHARAELRSVSTSIAASTTTSPRRNNDRVESRPRPSIDSSNSHRSRPSIDLNLEIDTGNDATRTHTRSYTTMSIPISVSDKNADGELVSFFEPLTPTDSVGPGSGGFKAWGQGIRKVVAVRR